MLASLFLVLAVASAEPFQYGLYSDEACVAPLPFEPNPIPLETDECQPWSPGFGSSSLEVISCSSSCICFNSSTGSQTCDGTVQSVKEICMNKCRLDDSKNTFLRLFDFTGCGDKQVPDEDYACPCTGMADNCVCAGECEETAPGATAQATIMALSLAFTVLSFLLA